MVKISNFINKIDSKQKKGMIFLTNKCIRQLDTLAGHLIDWQITLTITVVANWTKTLNNLLTNFNRIISINNISSLTIITSLAKIITVIYLNNNNSNNSNILISLINFRVLTIIKIKIFQKIEIIKTDRKVSISGRKFLIMKVTVSSLKNKKIAILIKMVTMSKSHLSKSIKEIESTLSVDQKYYK